MGLFRRLRDKSPQPPPTPSTSETPALASQATLVERPAPPKEEPSSAPKSLWERAYSQLKDENPELVGGFEQLVQNADAQDSSTSLDDKPVDRRATQAGVDHICATSQSRMEDAETKFKIRNKEYKAHDVFAKGIKVLAWAKDLAGLATSASPEASIACAALFLVLPLFENLDKVKEANQSGFTYVAASMKYYMALEPELLGIRSSISAELMEPAEQSIVDLYRNVLAFQLQSAIRFNRNKFKNKFRDMFDYDGWEDLLTSVKDAEALVALRWDAIQRTIAVRDLRGLREEALQSFQNLQSQVEDLVALTREQAKTTKEIAETVKRMEARALTDEENSHLQVLRHQNAAQNLSYEQAKARTEGRVPGTCQWLLEDDEYNTWLNSDSGLVLVSADPGCGKSVLSKYLVDEALPQDETICYFFFKDEDQNRLDQALSAILHQLMCNKAFLVSEHLAPVHEKNGDNLRKNTTLLWDILKNSLLDQRTGPVILVIDGLDECRTEDFEELSIYINQLFLENVADKHQTRCLMTTRPYMEITSQFEASHIRVSGEEKSELIRDEVKLVIQHKLASLKKMPNVVPAKLLPILEQKLLSIDHPTYLWLSLTFKFIQSKGFKKTAKGLDQAVDRLPRTINEAYEKILDRTDSEERPRVIKALTIVLGAVRPLTVGEMNVAMNFEGDMETMDDLDLEDDEDFEASLRDLTGLFITIYNRQIYFLHQTVREFLRSRDEATAGSENEGKWQGSISPMEANLLMGRTCVHYLWLYNNATELPLSLPESLRMPKMTDEEREFWGPRDRLSLEDCVARYHCTALFDYATEKGPLHLQDELDDELFAAVVQLVTQPKTRHWYYWALTERISDDKYVTTLFTAAEVGIAGVVGHIAKLPGFDIDVVDPEGSTALFRAVDGGHLATARALLEAGASPQPVVDGETWVPISWAARSGNIEMIKLLMAFGAELGKIGRRQYGSHISTLHEAVSGMSHETIRFVVENGADINCMGQCKGHYGECRATPLHNAAVSYFPDLVKLLISLGADVHAKDSKGMTALQLAKERDDRGTVKVLIEAGAVDDETIKHTQ